MTFEQFIADTDGIHACPHCGGVVHDDFTDFDGCCSDVCAKVASGEYWPSPVGPATHDEMQRWSP